MRLKCYLSDSGHNIPGSGHQLCQLDLSCMVKKFIVVTQALIRVILTDHLRRVNDTEWKKSKNSNIFLAVWEYQKYKQALPKLRFKRVSQFTVLDVLQ